MRIKKILLIFLSALMCAGLFQTRSLKVVAEDETTKFEIKLHTNLDGSYFQTGDGNLDTVTLKTDADGGLPELSLSEMPIDPNNTYEFQGFYLEDGETLYYNADLSLGDIKTTDKNIDLYAKWSKIQDEPQEKKQEEQVKEELLAQEPEIEKTEKEILLTSNEGEYLLLKPDQDGILKLYLTSNGKDLEPVNPDTYHMSIDSDEGSVTFDGVNITGTKFGLVIQDISSLVLRIKDGTTNNITVSASSDNIGYGIYADQTYINLDGTGTLNIKVTDANEVEGSELYGLYVSGLMTNTDGWDMSPNFYFDGTLNIQAGTENGIASGVAALFLATNNYDDYSVLTSGNICLLSSGFALQFINSYIVYEYNEIKETYRAYGGSNRTWHPIKTNLGSNTENNPHNVTNYDKNIDEYAASKSLIFANPVTVNFKYDDTSKIESEKVAKGGYYALPEPDKSIVIKKAEQGKFFAGWKDSEGNIKLPNAVVKIDAAQTFEAYWIDCDFTLVYNADADNGNIKRGFYKNEVKAENLLPTPVGLSFDNDGNLTASEFTFKTTAPVALNIVSSNTEKPVSLFVNYSLILSATNSDSTKDTTIGLQADNGVEIVGELEDIKISSKHDSSIVSGITSPKSYAIKGKSLNIQSYYGEYEMSLSAGNASDPDKCENIGVYVDDFKVTVDNNDYYAGYLDIVASKYPVYAKKVTLPDITTTDVAPYGASTITARPCVIVETEKVGDYYVYKNTKHLLIRYKDPAYTYLRFDATTHKFYEVTGTDAVSIEAEDVWNNYIIQYDSTNNKLILGDGSDNHHIFNGPIGLEIVNGDVNLHVNGGYTLYVQDYDPTATEIYGIKSNNKITLTSEDSYSNLTIRVNYSSKDLIDHLISTYTTKTPLCIGIQTKSLVLPYSSEQREGFSGDLNVHANNYDYSQLVNSIGIDITGTTAGSLSTNGARVFVGAYTDIEKKTLTETYAIRSKSSPSTVNEKILGNYKYNSDYTTYETEVIHDTTKDIYYYQVKNPQQQSYDSRLLSFSMKENSDTLVVDASTGKIYTNTITPTKEIKTMPEGFSIKREKLNDQWQTTITLNNFAYETSADAAIKILNGDVTIILADDSINSIVDKGEAYVNYGIYCENKITLQGKGTLNVSVGNLRYQADNYKTYGIYTRSLVLGEKDSATGFAGKLNVSAASYSGGEDSGIGIKVAGTTAKSLSISGGTINARGTLASIHTNAYPYVKEFRILGNIEYDQEPDTAVKLMLTDQGGYTYCFDSWDQARNLSIAEYQNVVRVKYVKGDADSGEVPSEAILNNGDNYNLEYNIGTLKKEGYIFKGWSDGTKEYKPGDTIENITQDITLKPTWTKIDFTIYLHDGDLHKGSEEGDIIEASDLGIEINDSDVYFNNVNIKSTSGVAFVICDADTQIHLSGTNKIEATGTDSVAIKLLSDNCNIVGGSGSLTLKGNKYGFLDASENENSKLEINGGYITAEVLNNTDAVAIKANKVNLVSNVHLSIKGNKTIEANTVSYNEEILNIKGSTSYTEPKETFTQATWSDISKTFIISEDQPAKQLATMPTAVTVYAGKGGLYTDANCTQKLDGIGTTWDCNADGYVISLFNGFSLDSTAKNTLVIVDEQVTFNIQHEATININNSSTLDNAATVITSYNPTYSYMDEYYGSFNVVGDGILNINSSAKAKHSKGLVASGINASNGVKVNIFANGLSDENGHSIGAYFELNDFSLSNYLQASYNASIYVKNNVSTAGIPIIATAKNLSSSIEQYYDASSSLANVYQLKDSDGYFYYFADKQKQTKVDNVYLSASSEAECKPYTLLIDGSNVYAKYENNESDDSDDEIYELSDADLYELGIAKEFNYETQTPYISLHGSTPFYSSARVAVELKNSPVIKLNYYDICSLTQKENSVALLIDDVVYFANDSGSTMNIYTNAEEDSIGIQVNNDSTETEYRNPIQFLYPDNSSSIYITTTAGIPLELDNQILPSLGLGDMNDTQNRAVNIKKDKETTDKYICYTQPVDPEKGQESVTRNLTIYNNPSSSYGFTLLFDVGTKKMYAVLNSDYSDLIEIPTADLKYNYNITIGDGEEYDVAFGDTDGRIMAATFNTSAPVAFQIMDSENPTNPREVKIQYNNYNIDAQLKDSIGIWYPNGDITITSKYEGSSLIGIGGNGTLIKCRNLNVNGMMFYLYQYTEKDELNNIELTGNLSVDEEATLLIGGGNNVVVNNLNIGDGTLAYYDVSGNGFTGAGGLIVNNNININSNRAQLLVIGYDNTHGAINLKGSIVYGDGVDETLIQLKGTGKIIEIGDDGFKDVVLKNNHFVIKDSTNDDIATTVKISYNSDYFVFAPGYGVVTFNASDRIKFNKKALTDEELANYGMKISDDKTELTLTSATNISTRAQFALLVLPMAQSTGTIIVEGSPTIESIFGKNDEPIDDDVPIFGAVSIEGVDLTIKGTKNSKLYTTGLVAGLVGEGQLTVIGTTIEGVGTDENESVGVGMTDGIICQKGGKVIGRGQSSGVILKTKKGFEGVVRGDAEYDAATATSTVEYGAMGEYGTYFIDKEKEIFAKTTILEAINSNNKITLIKPNGGNISTVGNITSAKEGATVELTGTADNGYGLLKWIVKTISGTTITVSNNKFVMPDEDVIVTAQFTNSSVKTITINSSTNGNVKTDVSVQVPGQEVNIVSSGNKGYGIDTLEIYYLDGEDHVKVPYSRNDDGTFTFVMPNKAVYVSSTFSSNTSGVFDIYIRQNENGSLFVDGDKVRGTYNQTSKLIASPDTSYTLLNYDAYSDEQYPVSIGGEETFTLEDSEYGTKVFITPYFATDNEKNINLNLSAQDLKVVRSTQLPGKTVTIEIPDYIPVNALMTLIVVDENEDNVSINRVNERKFTFVMPSSDVTVYAEYDHSIKFNINVENTEGGTLLVDNGLLEASRGDEIKVVADVKKGYKLADLSVYTTNGDRIKVIEKYPNFIFTMPDSDVIIIPEFDCYGEEVNIDDYDNEGSGSGTFSGTTRGVYPGSYYTFKLTPKAGSYLSSLFIEFYDDTCSEWKTLDCSRSGNEYTVYIPELENGNSGYSRLYIEYEFSTSTGNEHNIEVIQDQTDRNTSNIRIDNNLLVAPKDEKIYVYVNSNYGKGYTVKVTNKATGEEIPCVITKDGASGGNAAYFYMPDADVTVTGTFSNNIGSDIYISENIEGGTVTCNYFYGVPGDEIVFKATPDKNYVVNSINVIEYENSTLLPVKYLGNNTYSFIMPEEGYVEITAAFIPSSQATNLYDIKTISVGPGNMRVVGGVEGDRTLVKAAKGSEVNFIVVPHRGNVNWTLLPGSLVITNDSTGAIITPTYDQEDEVYTFTMPDSSVTIKSEFYDPSETESESILVDFKYDTDEATVTCDRKYFSQNDVLTFAVTPKEGFYIQEIKATVNWEGENYCDYVYDNGDGTYSMYFNYIPSDNKVTINISCVAEGAPDYHHISVDKALTKGGYLLISQGSKTETWSSIYSAKAGEQIDVYSYNPDNGLYNLSYVVKDKDGNIIPLINDAEDRYTKHFVMPDLDVIITPVYSDPKEVDVYINETTNGTVTSDKTSAKANETIQFVATPDEGYKLGAIRFYVIDKSVKSGEADLEYTFEDGKYVVTLPHGIEEYDSKIYVEARFTEANKKQILITQTDGGTISTKDKILLATPGEHVYLSKSIIDKDYAFNGFVIRDENYNIIETTVDGKGGTYFVMPDSDVTISGIFTKGNEKTIAISEDIDNGRIVCDRNTQYPGEKVVLYTVPDATYSNISIKVVDENSNEIPVYRNSETGAFEFVMPNSNVTVNGTFAKPYDIKIKSNLGGVIQTLNNTYVSNYGDTVTFVVVPNDGYALKGLYYQTKDGSPIKISDNKITMPNGDITVYAEYEATPYKITLKSSDIAKGHLVVSPSSTNVAAGTTMTISASILDTDYILRSINIVNSEGEDITDSIYNKTTNTFKMPADNITITGEFVKDQSMYSISAYANFDDGGSIIEENGYTKATPGTKMKYSIEANPGYEIVKVSLEYYVDDIDDWKVVTINKNASTGYYEFAMPAATNGAWVYVEFKQLSYPVNYHDNSNKNGEVYVDGYGPISTMEQQVVSNREHTLNITPPINPGGNPYIISSLQLVDKDNKPVVYHFDKERDNTYNYRFTMPSSAVRVLVNYEELVPAKYDLTINSPDGIIIWTNGNKVRYEAGDTITLNSILLDGYGLNNFVYTFVDEDGQPAEINLVDGANSFEMPASNVTVTASVYKKQNSVIVDQTAQHGSVTVDKDTPENGEAVTITVVPETNYYLKTIQAIVNPESQNPQKIQVNYISENKYQFTVPTKGSEMAIKVIPTFAAKDPNDIFISTDIKNGNVVETAGKTMAYDGESITITATPDEGYSLNELYYTFDESETATKYPITSGTPFNMPNASIIVHATFNANYYKLTPESKLTNGSISYDGTTKPGDKTMFQYNTLVIATISPDPGYTLESISVTRDTGVKVPVAVKKVSANKYTFMMPANETDVTGTFVPGNRYGIYVGDTENGAAFVTGNKTMASVGEKVYLTVTPDNGYVLDRIIVKNNETGYPITIQEDETGKYIIMPESSITVSATFKAKALNIEKSVDHGTISVYSNSKVVTKASIKTVLKVIVTPDTGYRLRNLIVKGKDSGKRVTLTGVEQNGVITYTFEMPGEDVEIKATLEEEKYSFSISGQGVQGTVNATLADGSVAPATIAKGTKVYLEAIPTEGYVFRYFTLDSSATVKLKTETATGKKYFIMPEASVKVISKWKNNTTYYWAVKDGKLHLSSTEYDTTSYPTSGEVTEAFTAENTQPWKEYASSITEAVIDKDLAVKKMAYLFQGLTVLTKVTGLEKLNGITSMASMFQGCTSLKSISLNGLDTSKVTSMYRLFKGCTSLESVDMKNLVTEKVTTMTSLFYGCEKLTSITWPTNLNITKVKGLGYMFYNCKNLTSLDLSKMKPVSATNTDRMFYNCEKLETIYIDESIWSLSSVTSSSNMFYKCKKLVGGNGTSYDANNISVGYAQIDKGPSSNQKGYLTDIKTRKLIFNYGEGADQASETTRAVTIDSEYGTLPTLNKIGKKQFDGWYTDSTGGTKVSASTKMTKDGATIYARWSLDETYDVKANSEITNGKVAFDKDYAKPNSTVTITVIPNDGYKLKAGTLVAKDTQGNTVPITNNTFTMPESDVTVTAEFEKDTTPHNVSVASGIDNGTIKADVDEQAFDNDVNLTITPNPGYKLDTSSLKYSYDDKGTTKEVLITGNSFKMPSKDVTIKGNFIVDTTVTFDLVVDNKIKNGTISLSKDTANVEDAITVTVDPVEGYQLKAGSLKYSNEGGSIVTSIDNYSFVMPGYKVIVTGEFEYDPDFKYSIGIDTTGNGTVKTNSATAAAGSTVTMTITPELGYKLQDGSLKVVNNKTSEEITVTDNQFVMPPSGVSISATFEVDTSVTQDVNLGSISHGTITPDISSGYVTQKVTLQATPEKGYTYDTITVKYTDGKGVEQTIKPTVVAVGKYEFNMPAYPVTIDASFKVDTSKTQAITGYSGAHGTVTPGINSTYVTDTVTLTVSPKTGYKLDTLTAKYNDGSEKSLELTKVNDTTYTFSMPAYDVTINATFTKKPSQSFYATRQTADEGYKMNELYMTLNNSGGNTTTIVEMRGIPMDAWTEIDGIPEITQPTKITGDVIKLNVLTNPSDAQQPKQIKIKALQSTEYTDENGEKVHDPAIVTVTLKNVSDESKPFTVSFKVYVTSEIEIKEGVYTQGSSEIPILATDEEISEFLDMTGEKEFEQREPMTNCYDGKACGVELQKGEDEETKESLAIRTHYTASEGSIRINLTLDKLKELQPGQYYIYVTTKTAITKIPFKIVAKPSPGPSPGPGKDESCEKVIGPTWHWNDAKGICEDTGVVRTYSR